MAKEPTPARKTPEEIAQMEEEIREYRAREAEERSAAMRDAAQPLRDVVESDGFKALYAALPSLVTLAQDRAMFPFLSPHVDAIANGLSGLQQTSDGIFAGMPTDSVGPA